jgi:hypothetical protein
MSLDLRIEFKDPARQAYNHPFSAQRVVRECWRPLAKRLDLPTLLRMEDLWISDRAEAEQLLADVRCVQNHLLKHSQIDVQPADAEYMLGRLRTILPAIEQAITEWEQIKELSL